MSKAHIVAEGDSIQSLAFEYGFFPNTIWNHPENAELREKRKVGTVLKIGDVVFIPDLRFKETAKPTEAEHVFRRKGVPERLRIRFLDEKNEPRGGRRYVVNIDGSLREGKTDADGFLSEYISPNAAHARLILYEKDAEEHYNLKLGHLQPITELAGIQSRLSSLGYPCLGEEPSGELTRHGILQFQKDFNLELTGQLNDETRAKLQHVYGA